MSNDASIEAFGLSAADLKGRLLEYGHQVLDEHPLSITFYAASEKLPLPFTDFMFDIALCAYPVDLTVIRELARVAKEVRIYRVVDNHGVLSPLVGPVLLGLQQDNYGVEVRDVPTSAIHEKNVMLRVWAKLCHV